MHILLFGKTGQIGWELQRSLSPLGKITAVSHNSNNLCGDFTNTDGIIKTIQHCHPDIIVNAAGYTAVDLAETETKLAEQLNKNAVSVIAKEAKKIGALFVHYSTDYVFDGGGHEAKVESNITLPINKYGETKLDGEIEIQRNCDKYLILRTSWVYSNRGSNFIKSIINLSQSYEKINVVNDQFGAPTGAELLADCTAHAIKKFITDSSLSGVYHLTASGCTTWSEYAEFILSNILESKNKINPVPSALYKSIAKRPLNSRLNTEKFQKTFDLYLPDWRVGVQRVIRELYYK